MGACDPYIQLISASIDGALTPDEVRKLEQHLSVCPQCRALERDLKQIHDTLSSLPDVQAPAGLKEKIMEAIEADNVTPLPVKTTSGRVKKTSRRWKTLASAAAVLALVILGSRSFLPGTGSSAPEAARFSLQSTGDAGTESAAGADKSVIVTTLASPAPQAVPAPKPESESEYKEAAANSAALDRAAAEELTPRQALELLVEEKGFSGFEDTGDTQLSWPKEGDSQDFLVYDALSENGRYYIFICYRNLASAEGGLAHNSRLGAYAVAVDGSEILEESGIEFWTMMSRD